MKSLNIFDALKSRITLFLVICVIAPLSAQNLSVGTDVVNRYVWRGTDFGHSPSIQPTVELGAGGFAIGFWGAYPTATTGTEEVDLYAGYNFDLNNSGSIYLGFTDYLFPTTSGFEITNFNGYDDPEPGSHYIEINAAYGGPESFPVSLAFNVFVHNVQNSPIYFEVGYSTAISDISLDLFLGGSAGDGASYYGSSSTFDIVNTGITASKEIKISDSFSMPIFGSIIVNPAADNLFYVVGFSL